MPPDTELTPTVSTMPPAQFMVRKSARSCRDQPHSTEASSPRSVRLPLASSCSWNCGSRAAGRRGSAGHAPGRGGERHANSVAAAALPGCGLPLAPLRGCGPPGACPICLPMHATKLQVVVRPRLRPKLP